MLGKTLPAAGMILVALCLPAPSAALPVTAVEFEEKPSLVGYDVSGMVPLRPGDEYSPDLLERSRRLLEATDLFRQVAVEAVEEDGGYRVRISVVPYELVDGISLTGNFLILKKDLARVLRLKVGDQFRDERAREDAAALLRIYEEEGYRGTQIRTEIERGRKGVKVVYRIKEGKPGVIRKLEFKGNESVPVEELSSLMRLTLFTFFRREKLSESIDRIEKFYREEGFLEVIVSADLERSEGVVPPAISLVDPIKGLATILPGQSEVVDITMIIEEGQRYVVDLSGNENYTAADLLSRLSFAETGFFDEHEAEVGRRRLLDYYLQRGYYQSAVDLDFDREAGRVGYTVHEGKQFRVGRIVFEGVDFFEREWLLSKLKISEAALDNTRLLRRDYLAEDPRRIRDHYRHEGFLDVKVAPAEVALEASPEGSEVFFVVEEGVRTLVGEITFEGVTAVSEEELREVVRSAEEMPYRPGWVTRDMERILRLVSGRGYPRCKVSNRVHLSSDRETADIHFIVEQGQHRHLGKVVVVGNRKTRERVIIRELTISGDDPYSFGAVTASKRKLYGLGFFQEVKFAIPDPVESGAEQDLVIRVRERPTGLFQVGGGYNSEERLGGFVEVGELNLFGTGRGLSARAKISTIERRFDVFLREPWPFGYRINSEANLFEEFREEQGYDITRRGVSLGVKKEYLEQITVNLRYRFEFVDYENVQLEFIDEEERESLEPIDISSIIALVGYDRRDNPVLPHRGSHHLFGVEVATPVLGGDTSFNKYTLETAWFFPLSEKSEVVLGLRGGFSQTLTGFGELPLSERFFLGGARGVRGYDEDVIGPKDDAGNPIGGDAYALGIAEYRFPLGRKRWRGVVFFDVGNVWVSLAGIEPTEAKSSVGVGLRYNTPVGPLRLDYGVKIDPQEGESAGRIHFNIGFPF